MPYLRSAATIGISTVVMFVLMYLNTYAPEPVFASDEKAYMAIVTCAAMAAMTFYVRDMLIRAVAAA